MLQRNTSLPVPGQINGPEPFNSNNMNRPLPTGHPFQGNHYIKS